MLHDPIRQRALEADIVSSFLGFNPFVLQDFLALRLELTIQRGVFQQVARGWFFRVVRHTQIIRTMAFEGTLRWNAHVDNQKLIALTDAAASARLERNGWCDIALTDRFNLFQRLWAICKNAAPAGWSGAKPPPARPGRRLRGFQ